MKPVLAVVYVVLLLPSLLFGAIVWECVAVDKLFYCWDSVGVPGDFIPPFAHDAERKEFSDRKVLMADRARGGIARDYYFIAPSLVYLVWGMHVIVAFALPAFLFWAANSAFNFVRAQIAQKH